MAKDLNSTKSGVQGIGPWKIPFSIQLKWSTGYWTLDDPNLAISKVTSQNCCVDRYKTRTEIWSKLTTSKNTGKQYDKTIMNQCVNYDL